MAKRFYEENNIQAIANAIRSKNHTANTYTVPQMPQAIGIIRTVDEFSLQDKTVTPTTSQQVISADEGYDGLNHITISAMPEGVLAIPEVNENGLVTAEVSTSGYLEAGESNTLQLATKTAEVITPSTVNQTIEAGQYLTGAITVPGDANFTEANIASGVTLWGKTGTHVGGVAAPTKGFQATAWDSDGYVTAGKIYGTSVPAYLFTSGSYGPFHKLQNVLFTDEVTSISNSAFYKCTSLALTSLPETITLIGQNAFFGCSSLALSSLPNVSNTIQSCSFKGCSALALTSIPDTVIWIDYSAFEDCTSLVTLRLPSGLDVLNSAFKRCTGLTTVTFSSTPSGWIDADTFTGCTNLTTINVPWASGAVANAPWGATNATINYNYTGV